MAGGWLAARQRHQMGFRHAVECRRLLARPAPRRVAQARIHPFADRLLAYVIHRLPADAQGGPNRFIGPTVVTAQ